jgi:GTP cyclohydrolase I
MEENIRNILRFIGEDPTREGLKETPERVVRMYKEIFRGYNPECKPKVSIFQNGKDNIRYDEMIIDTGDYYSHCEHHMVPFFGKYWFAYLPSPDGGIIGLSKVARIVDYHAAKLQIQERLVNDIVTDIWNALSEKHTPPLGMALIMQGEHLCKTMRGAKKKGMMTTSKMLGVFLDKPEAKAELMQLIRQ